jgi:hypothetical protein
MGMRRPAREFLRIRDQKLWQEFEWKQAADETSGEGEKHNDKMREMVRRERSGLRRDEAGTEINTS